MPLLKYYCDYCEKQFQDTPSARKRHLQGLPHQHAKALYYQNSSSSSSFLAQNHQIHPSSFGKGVCNRFLRTRSCQYGDSCKYYHPKQNFQSVNPQGIPENIHSSSTAESQLVGGGPFPGGRVRDSMGISLGNLPPSLKPPPEGGYAPLPFIDWG